MYQVSSVKATKMPKLTILWGLPGSGKTSYAERRWPYGSYRYYVLDCDNYGRGMKLEDIVFNVSSNFSHRTAKDFILDGLFNTNEQVDKLLDAISRATKLPEIEIIYWAENREACLWNDRGRRKMNSEVTIKHAPFEEPSRELINKYKITLVRENVERKPIFKVWAGERNLGSGNKLKSDTWCLGGYSKNCWGDQHQVSAGTQPVSFVELDNFLAENYPNITFMQYKKIMNDCVTTETTGDSDYYGGYVEYGYFECNLRLLYQTLQDLDVVKEEE